MNAPAVGEIIRRDGHWWRVLDNSARVQTDAYGVPVLTVTTSAALADPVYEPDDDWYDHPHNPISTEEIP